MFLCFILGAAQNLSGQGDQRGKPQPCLAAVLRDYIALVPMYSNVPSSARENLLKNSS